MKIKVFLYLIISSLFTKTVYAEEAFQGSQVNVSCDGIFTSEALELIREALGWFRILAPIILIVLVAVDFGKVVLSQERDAMPKAISSTIKRAIATIGVIFTPTIVIALSKLPGVNQVLSSDPLCSSATGTAAQSSVQYEISPSGQSILQEGGVLVLPEGYGSSSSGGNGSSGGSSGGGYGGSSSYSEGSGNDAKRSYKTVTINGRTYDMYRQGYLEDISYQSGNLALYGCGPIAFATAASGFNDDITAYDAAKLCKSRSFSGIMGALDSIGISYSGPYYYNSNDRDEERVAEMAALVRNHFAEGKPVIALVTGGNNGENKYATNNHFITLLGEVNGEVIISNCGTERGDLEEIIRYYLKGGRKGFLLVG